MNKKNIQTEVDASFLYGELAKKEEDPNVAEIFRQMSGIEKGHAMAFLKKSGLDPSEMPGPSRRAKILMSIGKMIGSSYVLGVLLDTEKSISASIFNARKATRSQVSLSDTAHVKILQNVINHSNISGPALSRFEMHHRSVGGNALRAAVLGGNDGLVSNFSLVMGVAGATNGQQEVLLAGIAGLLAGALSMALGEWISVKSSQELSENQMQLELEELESNPDSEEKELALIYKAKGVSDEESVKIAHDLISDKDQAYQTLIREELGINPDEMKGSAIEAAVASFFLFAIGAIIPVIPFFFKVGFTAIAASIVLSTCGLFLIGSAITLFTGKNIWYSGLRQIIFGLAAAGITFGIGHLIGIAVGG